MLGETGKDTSTNVQRNTLKAAYTHTGSIAQHCPVLVVAVVIKER